MNEAIYTIIGTVIGILGTIILSVINNRHQEKLAKQNNLNKLEIERLKIEEENKHLYIRETTHKVEDIYRLLSKVKREYSITESYIASIIELTPQEYSKKYFDECSDLDEIRSLIIVNFPDLTRSFDEITGLTNIFWGAQQNLLYSKQKDNKRAYQTQANEIAKTAKEIYIKINEIERQLQRFFKQIK